MRSIFLIAVLAITIGLTIKIMQMIGRFGFAIERIGLDRFGFLHADFDSKARTGQNLRLRSDERRVESRTVDDQRWSRMEIGGVFSSGHYGVGKKGETTVYVINSFTHQVQIFELRLKEKLLVHKKTVADVSISNANNLIAIGRDQFYITNFVHYAHPVGFALEFIQKLPFGSVWFYDGSKFVRVLDGLRGPNGIAVSKSKRFLYLATHMEEQLRVYRIEQSPLHTNLTLVNSVDLYTGVDNLNVDHQGSVWIGAHPIRSLTNPFCTCSIPKNTMLRRRVLKIDFNADHSEWQLEEIFADDGTKLSGSASAALTPDGRKLLIGTVMHKMMICHIG